MQVSVNKATDSHPLVGRDQFSAICFLLCLYYFYEN